MRMPRRTLLLCYVQRVNSCPAYKPYVIDAQLTMQLTAVPDGSSPCPYEIASKKRNAEEAAREDEHLGQQVGCLILRAGRRHMRGNQQRHAVAASATNKSA